MFAALEGIDGCGKSTIADALEKEGYTVTREPYMEGTREVITRTKNPETRELAFYVDRLYHLEDFILPALERGKRVVTDRYKYSQIAYAFARYQGLEIYQRVLELNARVLEPDHVVFVDVRPEVAMARKPRVISEARPFLREGQGTEEFLEAVRRRYFEMKGPNWVVVDGEKEEREVLAAVLEALG
ncbi:MAG: dTMP kinase [Candidatus Hydrothermarchaeota archaeon]